jgi:hypothetical protein
MIPLEQNLLEHEIKIIILRNRVASCQGIFNYWFFHVYKLRTREITAQMLKIRGKPFAASVKRHFLCVAIGNLRNNMRSNRGISFMLLCIDAEKSRRFCGKMAEKLLD